MASLDSMGVEEGEGGAPAPMPLRRSERIAALRAKAAAAVEQGTPLGDPDVMTAVLDAADAISPGAVGGARKQRGGESEALKAARDAVRGVFGAGGGVITLVDKAIGATIRSAPAIAGIGIAATVLNHPTLLGNLSQLCAAVFAQGTNAAITSTWGDWGTALFQIAQSMGLIVQTVAGQVVQGPVVPVAVASALLMWLAANKGKRVTDFIKEDIGGAFEGQIQAAKEAYAREGVQVAANQLKQLAERTKVPTAGEGAAAMSALARGAPLLAVSSPQAVMNIAAEGVVVVPGAAPRPIAQALAPLAKKAAKKATKLEDRQGAKVALSRRAKAMGETPSRTSSSGNEADTEGAGRRRKTKKAKKTKRRVTRRKL